MPQIAIYLDKETADVLEQRARTAGLSKSAYVREAINQKLKRESPTRGFPQWWLDNLGTWEDDRSPEEILRDIREGTEQPDRVSFD